MEGKIKTNLKNFLKDESGQSTTEYVLLLVFIVAAVSKVGGTLKNKLDSLVSTIFNKAESAAGNIDAN
jgi:Flp pilus assembly pilin Flp